MVNRYEVNELNDQSFHQYYKEISIKNKKITYDEKEFFEEYAKTKNKDLRNKIVEANLRLVVSIAKDYMYFGLPFLDLIQEGNIGLMKAVDRFDVSYGTKFSTYATYWIKQSILRALENKSSLIRIPTFIYDNLVKIRVASSKYYDSFGEYPNNNVLQELTGLSLKDILFALKYNYNFIYLSYYVESIDRVKKVEIVNTLVDGFCVEDHIEEKELLSNIGNMLRILSLRELDIVISRYGLFEKNKDSLETLSKRHNLCKERVRQIENSAVKKLQDKFFSED